MGKVEYSPIALEDLNNLNNYFIDNWGESVARRILKKITTDIKKLEIFPLMGTNLAKVIDTPTDYRYLFVEKNYVFYHAEQDKVRIVRVLNEQQDFISHLFGVTDAEDK